MTYPTGTAARLVEVALAEVGTIEEGDNLTKYGKFMKADGLPWCGSFVNWCADQAGIKIPTMVSTAAGANKMKDLGRWIDTKPQVGDLWTFRMMASTGSHTSESWPRLKKDSWSASRATRPALAISEMAEWS
jgi:hypothetical protein